MLFAHQPAHVAEEEPTVGVMGIGIRVTEFVVETVISDPNVGAVLNKTKLLTGKSSIWPKTFSLEKKALIRANLFLTKSLCLVYNGNITHR